jgi:hypothetical protein
MNGVLLEKPFLPQPLDNFLPLTNSGFISYFSFPNGSLKEIRRMKWPLAELFRKLGKGKDSKNFLLVCSAIRIIVNIF